MEHTIYHDLVIKVSKDKVFDAFTLPAHLDKWWTLKSSGTPQLNSEYNLNFTDKYDWYCKVVKCEPNKEFYLKMTQADEDWNPTTFGVELEDHKEGTLLKFTHTDWEHNNHHFRNTAFCWALLLKGLKNYLEKGIVLPFEKRD